MCRFAPRCRAQPHAMWAWWAVASRGFPQRCTWRSAATRCGCWKPSASAGVHPVAAARRPSSAWPPGRRSSTTLVGAADARRIWDMSVEALLAAARADRDTWHRLRLRQPARCTWRSSRGRSSSCASWHARAASRTTTIAASPCWTPRQRAASWPASATSPVCSTPTAAHIHPLKYVRGLADAAERAGVVRA